MTSFKKKVAQNAEKIFPVSNALGFEIKLSATLVS